MKFTEHTLIGKPEIDTEAGVIKGVKIIGRESKNNRTYSPKALEQARGMYEDVRVNIDHSSNRDASAERSISEGFGVIKNPVLRDDGVYGDLHYLTSHQDAAIVLETAKRFPGKLGMSHVAEGDGTNRDGKFVVEEITEVFSVDIVQSPATTAGLFESENPMTKKKTLRQLIEARYPTTGKRALREMEHEGLMDAGVDTAVIDPDAVVEDGVGPVEAVKTALADEVVKIFLDDAIPPNDTTKQIGDLVKTVEKVKATLEGKKSAEESSDPTETSTPTTESLQFTGTKQLRALTETVNDLKRRSLVTDILAESSLTRVGIGAEHLELLEKQPDEDAMRQLVESWPRGLRVTNRPLMESVGEHADCDSYPNTYEDVAAMRAG